MLVAPCTTDLGILIEKSWTIAAFTLGTGVAHILKKRAWSTFLEIHGVAEHPNLWTESSLKVKSVDREQLSSPVSPEIQSAARTHSQLTANIYDDPEISNTSAHDNASAHDNYSQASYWVSYPMRFASKRHLLMLMFISVSIVSIAAKRVADLNRKCSSL